MVTYNNIRRTLPGSTEREDLLYKWNREQRLKVDMSSKDITLEDILRYPSGTKERLELLRKNDEYYLLDQVERECVPFKPPVVPVPMDLTYPDHYLSMDTGYLYRCYVKMKAMIKDYGEDFRMAKVNIDDYEPCIRGIIQDWIDGVRYRQRIFRRPTWLDDVEFFLRGRLKERIRYRHAFVEICLDLVDELNLADGGLDNNNPEAPPVNHIGFGI